MECENQIVIFPESFFAFSFEWSLLSIKQQKKKIFKLFTMGFSKIIISS